MRTAGGHREPPKKMERGPWEQKALLRHGEWSMGPGEGHRNGNKDAYHRDREVGQAKWEKVTEMGMGETDTRNP